MNGAESYTPSEEQESLWLLVAAPAIWAAHFLVSYVTAAVWCSRFAGRDGLVDGVTDVVLWFTVAALAGIGFVAWGAYERHGHFWNGSHERDTPLDRHRFLAHATLLLAGLSAIATIFSALAASFFTTCQ